MKPAPPDAEILETLRYFAYQSDFARRNPEYRVTLPIPVVRRIVELLERNA